MNNNYINNDTIDEIIEKYNKNKTLIIVLGIVLILLIIIFFRLSFKKREVTKISEYKYNDKKRVYKKMKSCKEITDDTKFNILADYDICASYNTGLVGNQKSDYISLEMIKKIVQSGARYIEFHIVTNIKNDKPKPYIGIGEYPGDWIYTLNLLDVDDVFRMIERYAFNNDINYPLIIYLKFNNFKKFLINKVGEIIRDNLDKYLLRNSKYHNIPFTVEKMCNLENKIIFLSNLNENQMENTEYKSINIPQLGFVKRMHYKDAYNYLFYSKDGLDEEALLRKSLTKETFIKENKKFDKLYPTLNNKILSNEDFFQELLDHNFLNPLLHFNKVGLTIILPHKNEDIFTSNYDPEPFRNHGVQITTMNFQEYNPSPKPPDHEDSTLMDKYIHYFNFKNSGIVLKSASKFTVKDKIYVNEFKDTIEEDENKRKINKNTTFKNNIIGKYPITINNKLFLSKKKDMNLAVFQEKKHLFMIHQPFDKEFNEGFIISSLDGVIPFNYKNRLCLTEYMNNFIFTKPKINSKLYNKKSTFEPIKALDKISDITLSNVDKNNYKYLGNRNNILSLYNIDTNIETVNKCSLKITTYENKDNDIQKIVIYLYIQHNLSKLYMSVENEIIAFNNNKRNENNKFEMDFIDGNELNIYGSFYLKIKGNYLYYDNIKNIMSLKSIKKESSIFKIEVNPNTNKENLLIQNDITKNYDTFLKFDEKKFYTKKAIFTNKKDRNISVNCFLLYTLI